MSQNKTRIPLAEIYDTSKSALVRHGAREWVANEVAKAITRAEATGNIICGLYYLESYCVQLTTGRVVGDAEPEVRQPKPAAVNVDARYGFAQAAFAKGLDTAVAQAGEQGLCALAISHSHTCTSLGYFTSQIAESGFIGLGFTNAPACVAPPGGNLPVLGTNPIAMSVPAENSGLLFQFDQSTTAIAIGKIRMAAANGESIPAQWGIDKHGQATTDPNAVLDGGTLLSAGGYKGYGFGLMAEVFAAAVSGSVLSIDAEPLKAPEGGPHNLGQFYFLIEPTLFSGDQFWKSMGTLDQAVTAQDGARLPGGQKTDVEEVSIDSGLWTTVQKLAQG